MVSVVVPISYLLFLFGSLAIFSRFYRKRQHGKEQEVEPWFPKHKSRDVYISLLSMDPPPAQPVLVAALLRRAMDDVRMIWDVRDAKSALQTMLQKGQVGDDLWERFTRAEKELEAEIVEVVGEANTFQEGYGQHIFGLASDMVQHERIKQVYEKIPSKRTQEAERMAAPPPYLALSPQAYLQPTSLSLAPSNPLSAASRTIEVKPEAPTSLQTTQPDMSSNPAPKEDQAAVLKGASADETPRPAGQVSAIPSPANGKETPSSDEPADHVAAEDHPVSPAAVIKPTTPSAHAKKPINKRKKVKGGR
ncbi:hypothetical protein ACM66B_004840 [Microbotryomycetes sp. NB124-2]